MGRDRRPRRTVRDQRSRSACVFMRRRRAPTGADSGRSAANIETPTCREPRRNQKARDRRVNPLVQQPELVDSPTTVKNTGHRKSMVTSSRRSEIAALTFPFLGIATPKRNAPKMACMPIMSVAQAERNTPMITPAIIAGVTPPSSCRSPPDAEVVVARRTSSRPRRPAKVRGFLEHRANSQRSRCRRPRRGCTTWYIVNRSARDGQGAEPSSGDTVSARMRASTGKAVMAIAVPIKRAKLVKLPLPYSG